MTTAIRWHWPPAALALLAFSLPASSQQVKKVAVDARIACAKPFDYVAAEGVCKPNQADVDKLSADQCKGSGLAFVGTPAACVVDARQAPAPTCSGGGLATEFDATLRQCVVKDETPRSSLGDYLGDCFRIKGLPADAPAWLKPGFTYAVVFQRPEGANDKMLRLAEAEGEGTGYCRAKSTRGLAFDIRASDIEAIGADRAGWTYGVLALPYKYHLKDHSFGSGVSIGPYVGRRWGTPGTAYTFAMAATLGSVKGEVRDAQGTLTGTPDLQAFSVALGWMYDISKSPGLRPFKVGFFVGADAVGSDNAVKYKYNKKPWIALQIGFDFTDN